MLKYRSKNNIRGFCTQHFDESGKRKLVQRDQRNVCPACKKENGGLTNLEFKRKKQLEILQQKGEISDLQTQVKFVFIKDHATVKINGKVGRKTPDTRYYADFVYFDERRQRTVVEDTKGHQDTTYKLKRALFLDIYVAKEPFYEFFESYTKGGTRYTCIDK